MLVPGAGAGAGAVSRLCTWWRQVAGAGAVGAGCRCWCSCCAGCAHVGDRLVVLVPGAGAGAGGVACICKGGYFRIFFPDSEAMGFILQLTTMSCLRALSRQVGADAVSWLCTWWRQSAWVPVLVVL